MAWEKKSHFDVHPSVVYQLGESLITDAVQALIELIKNAYDADATYARVIIDTEGTTEVPGSIYESSGGRILVEDDGHGMDLEDIESGWLMISNRKKRELKQEKKTTPGGRTPLGDKGLGRLGVQRLGEHLEIFTKTSKSQGYHLGFSWLDFAKAPTLQEVDIHLDKIKFSRAHGTRVVVSNLQEIDTWRGQFALKRLEQELSRMISPYKQIRQFIVIVEVDGKVLELQEISDKIRDIAPIRYSLTFDGKKFLIEGKARLGFFKPQKQKEADQFALIVESDNGKAFYDFLISKKLAKTLRLSKSPSKNWFVEFRWDRNLDNIDKIESDIKRNGEIANPGPFHGEVDSFDLGTALFQQQNVFNKISEYRRHIKELSGVRVYRDGFAIRVDHDWLNLGAQWTSAPSYYGLKPDNTLGYIALSARDNIDLEETTDREGFKDTPYYRNFFSLIKQFRNFTTTTQNFFGRSWVEFRNKKSEELARIDTRKTVEDISKTIKQGLATASNHQKKLHTFHTRLKDSVKESRLVINQVASAKEIKQDLREKVIESLSDIEPLLKDAESAIKQISNYLSQIDNLKNMSQVLENKIEGLRNQMDEMYETVALGLTAEALSHEVFNVADQLAKRTKAAQTHLRSKKITDPPIMIFIEYVNSAVKALRKQMSFLSPALRYVREHKNDIHLVSFLEDFAEFYDERLKKNKISITIIPTSGTVDTIRMNKGKLTQIIDNLVLNSEYWLKEDIAQKRLDHGTIVFEFRQPFLYIFDDGRGIDPSVEHALFEPFISTKADGRGRGLGLFIVKQLLDSEGCNIGILPERNEYRRFYKFQIDFRGAIYD